MAVGYKKKKTKILKEVPFEEEKIEEAAPVEDGVLTKDQFFQKVQQRPMSAHGIEMWARYLEDPKGFKF
tara:strand:- start:724 stop:930 length:207 start_codon:yes stop_codon:yes gene_type:complete